VTLPYLFSISISYSSSVDAVADTSIPLLTVLSQSFSLVFVIAKVLTLLTLSWTINKVRLILWCSSSSKAIAPLTLLTSLITTHCYICQFYLLTCINKQKNLYTLYTSPPLNRTEFHCSGVPLNIGALCIVMFIALVPFLVLLVLGQRKILALLRLVAY